MLNGKERNGMGRRKWNDQNTHTERFTSERNRKRGREGVREGGREGGKIFLYYYMH